MICGTYFGGRSDQGSILIGLDEWLGEGLNPVSDRAVCKSRCRMIWGCLSSLIGGVIGGVVGSVTVIGTAPGAYIGAILGGALGTWQEDRCKKACDRKYPPDYCGRPSGDPREMLMAPNFTPVGTPMPPGDVINVWP